MTYVNVADLRTAATYLAARPLSSGTTRFYLCPDLHMVQQRLRKHGRCTRCGKPGADGEHGFKKCFGTAELRPSVCWTCGEVSDTHQTSTRPNKQETVTRLTGSADANRPRPSGAMGSRGVPELPARPVSQPAPTQDPALTSTPRASNYAPTAIPGDIPALAPALSRTRTPDPLVDEAPTRRAAHQVGGNTPTAKMIYERLLSSATVLLHAALQLFDTAQQEQGQEKATHAALTRASQLEGLAEGLAARIGSMDRHASLL